MSLLAGRPGTSMRLSEYAAMQSSRQILRKCHGCTRQQQMMLCLSLRGTAPGELISTAQDGSINAELPCSIFNVIVSIFSQSEIFLALGMKFSSRKLTIRT